MQRGKIISHFFLFLKVRDFSFCQWNTCKAYTMMVTVEKIFVCNLLFVVFVMTVLPYSTNERSFLHTLSSGRGYDIVVNFDPFLETVENILKSICENEDICLDAKHLDKIKDEYERSVNGDITAIIKESIFSLSSLDNTEEKRFEWLIQADDKAYNESMAIRNDTLKMWKLLLSVQAGLGLTEQNEFLGLVDKWRVQSFFNVLDGDALLHASIELFNAHNYEMSYVVSIYLLLLQDETLSFTNILIPRKHSSFILSTDKILTLYSLLSELYQLKNNMLASISFQSKTLILLSKQLVYQSNSEGKAIGLPTNGIDTLPAFIARIRAVLFLPILPTTSEKAVANREKLLNDIKMLTGSFERSKKVFTIQELVDQISVTFFRLAHQGLNDKEINIAINDLYRALCPDFSYTARRLDRKRMLDFTQKSLDNKKSLKLSFVSSHFYHHSIGRMLIELIHYMKLDQQTINVELFCFYMTGTHYAKDDGLTAIFEELLGKNFIRVPIADIHAMRTTIGSEAYDLDAIIFADVGMEIQSIILANSRLAPLQIAWWGHPVTTGSPAIDYYFGLDVEVSNAGPSHYSEQLIRMEWMNTAPVVPLSTASKTFRSFGLPSNSQHFIVLGRLFKVHPSFDEAIFNILLNTSPSVYIVLVREKDNVDLASLLYQRWKSRQEMICCESSEVHSNDVNSCCRRASSGSSRPKLHDRDSENVSLDMNPRYVLSRIFFIHYEYYVDALLTATAVLDTFPYGGCLTTHDALSNSIPLLTLPLEHVRGRYSFGMYQQMGHIGLVAKNLSSYVELATRLTVDETFRQSQVAAINERYKKLHQNQNAAKEWLNFLVVASRQHRYMT